MTLSGIQSGMVGMGLWQAWENAMVKTHHLHKPQGSALVHAAFQAFEGYLKGQEATHAAMIASVGYTLNAQGTGAQLITKQQMAPLLALNVMA